MSSSSPETSSDGRRLRQGTFRTTQWELVADAARSDVGISAGALEQLCAGYWYPLYAFVRRSGHGPGDAEDLTQGFLGWLLESGHLRMADRERGRFRSFLLVRLKHYLSDEWKRQRALKRGGGVAPCSLDEPVAEARFAGEGETLAEPERAFDRSWAMTCLERAVDRLKAEYAAAGRAELYEALREFQLGSEAGAAYETVARRLGVSESAVKSAIFRLRRRQSELLRDEVGRTVGTAGDVDAELRYLVKVLAG